jgi:arsenate reductase
MRWLKDHEIDFEFHNYKSEGIDKSTLQYWSKEVGWEKLFNTKGTTWKRISPDFEGIKITAAKAIAIMLEHNSIIKRPVIEGGEELIVGHDESLLMSLLKKK